MFHEFYNGKVTTESEHARSCWCPDCRPSRLQEMRDRRTRRLAEARNGKRAIRHGTNSAYSNDGCRCEECAFAKRMIHGLQCAKRKLARGTPLWALSAWECEMVEDELAYREGRQWWHATPDGRVLEAIIPRWAGDGWFAPRRTVLEQLEAAQRYEP